jgi:nitrogen regulatory protein P-II 2
MNLTMLSLVTIVAESLLRDRLVSSILAAGAKGFTITEAEGEGSRHRRVSEILGANIRIETIVSEQVAEVLLSTLSNEYFERYAVIAYVSQVQVVRGTKYV